MVLLRILIAHMPSRATSRSATPAEKRAALIALAASRGETVWGAWLSTQPPGTLTRSWKRGELSWTTVNKAKKHLVTHESAVELVKLAGGAFRASDMTKPSRAAQKRAEAA